MSGKMTTKRGLADHLADDHDVWVGRGASYRRMTRDDLQRLHDEMHRTGKR